MIERKLTFRRTPKLIDLLVQRWFLFFVLIYSGFVALPWLAPIFMHLGWTAAGKIVYTLYFPLCHQLPQRSFFLFGPQVMIDLPAVRAASADTLKPLILRQFVGNIEMGWKVAWSDRMVSMYTSVLLLAWVWRPLRKLIKPLPWWGLILLLLPMAFDGGSHAISDLAGLGQGFRDSNAWLAGLTGNTFSVSFYAGDALGSFNSWMRLLTGLLFGLSIVWAGMPLIEELFVKAAQARLLQYEMRTKLEELRKA